MGIRLYKLDLADAVVLLAFLRVRPSPAAERPETGDRPSQRSAIAMDELFLLAGHFCTPDSCTREFKIERKGSIYQYAGSTGQR